MAAFYPEAGAIGYVQNAKPKGVVHAGDESTRNNCMMAFKFDDRILASLQNPPHHHV